MPILTENIKTSNENGLREYILAIAAEEISGKHMNRENSYSWSNAKEWLTSWNIFLRNIPTKVTYIINNSEASLEVKEQALDELGLMSLPYIQDAIHNGHKELQNIYDVICSKASSTMEKQPLGSEPHINDAEIDILRSMVENVSAD